MLLALDRALQGDRPQGGRRILARPNDPPAGADLVLQPEQIELVALHLADEPLADEIVADASRGYRDDSGHESEVRGQGSGVRVNEDALQIHEYVEQFGRDLNELRGRLVNALQRNQVDGFFVEAHAADGLQLAVERAFEDAKSFGDRLGDGRPLADRVDQPVVDVGQRRSAGRIERLVEKFRQFAARWRCRFAAEAAPLAANLASLPSPRSSLLMPMSRAVEPVKNVLSPSAANTPLVSPSNANSVSLESEAISSLPLERHRRRNAVDRVERRGQVVERRVVVQPVELDEDVVRFGDVLGLVVTPSAQNGR